MNVEASERGERESGKAIEWESGSVGRSADFSPQQHPITRRLRFNIAASASSSSSSSSSSSASSSASSSSSSSSSSHPKAAEDLPVGHRRTPRPVGVPARQMSRSVLECGCPLPLFLRTSPETANPSSATPIPTPEMPIPSSETLNPTPQTSNTGLQTSNTGLRTPNTGWFFTFRSPFSPKTTPFS